MAVCLGASAVVAASGAAWEVYRFGTTPAATARRLEQEVRSRLAYQSRRVESLARGVATERERVRLADVRPEAVAPLFDRLAQLSAHGGLAGVSATVYVPRASGTHRVLAWSEGPGEDLPDEQLNRASPALFVAPGPSGLRLIALHQIDDEAGARIGIASAELRLSARAERTDPPAGSCSGWLATSYGPVEAVAPCGRTGAQPPRDAFVVENEQGVGLLEVRFNPDALDARRVELRRLIVAAASIPLLLLALLLTAPAMARRNRSQTVRAWLGWTGLVGSVVVATAAAALWLGALIGHDAVTPAVVGLTGLALASLVAGGWWWRPRRFRPDQTSRVWFLFEHALGGVLVTATLWLLVGVLQGRVRAVSIGVWQFPLFPFDADALLYFVGVLLTQIALWWTTGSLLGILAARWRLGHRRPHATLAAIGLWTAPTVGLLAAGIVAARPPGAWLGVLAALATFGAFSGSIRRHYRHTTQAMRLVLLFAALAGPPLWTYPLTAGAADDAARALIESEFAPAILDQPAALLTAITEARDEIDAIEDLEALLRTPAAGDSRSAYRVWSQTRLSAARLTSEIELFGPDLRLNSRFALNVPEYPYADDRPRWTGSGCHWEVFGEAGRFGAQERVMLHAERAVCDRDGQVLGAVVMHLVSDYRSLAFISAESPYAEALGTAGEPSSDERLAGLEVVVYGWNDAPLFTSGGVAWPIAPELSARLYASREPFWQTLVAGPMRYAVYFVNDRRGFYALGYPYPTFMEHATRLSEITAIVVVLLVLLLAGATVYAPLVARSAAPLPALFAEIRTSFYRKLFLFFVLSAVGPVVLLALAFGAYTAARIHADVEAEATSAVTITRRLFEEFAAFARQPDQEQAPASDELLVLIRQMTNQDVNLYVGSRLAASSQRDLFDSGLLPTRTPAGVYRQIALSRLPAYVGEDRIGGFTYLVAAAPIPARGRDVVISVPLGTRQREIEHQIDELNRRMLVGTVVVVLLAAGLGASVAGRVSDPVARLTRAARQIAAGRLDVRILADTADELRRLVDDFNAMTATLATQRAELARSNQLKAWAQMARQVAHEIKNPLTPIQLAAEHLQRVHADQHSPLGQVVDQCVVTILGQVRLLRQIASDFSNFAAEPTPRFEDVSVAELLSDVMQPYRLAASERLRIDVFVPGGLPLVRIDRTLVARAVTNLVENAIQAMPQGGTMTVTARAVAAGVSVAVADTGVGMDAEAARRAFEPYFSTKTGGSGLGLPNAKRYVEISGGSTDLESAPGGGTTITLTLPAVPPGGTSSSPASTR